MISKYHDYDNCKICNEIRDSSRMVTARTADTIHFCTNEQLQSLTSPCHLPCFRIFKSFKNQSQIISHNKTENTKIPNHSRFYNNAYCIHIGGQIIAEISKLPDIKEVRGAYGVHDVFVKVKSDNTEAMNHTITNKIRKIPGITSTVTLLVIDEQGGKESI